MDLPHQAKFLYRGDISRPQWQGGVHGRPDGRRVLGRRRPEVAAAAAAHAERTGMMMSIYGVVQRGRAEQPGECRLVPEGLQRLGRRRAAVAVDRAGTTPCSSRTSNGLLVDGHAVPPDGRAEPAGDGPAPRGPAVRTAPQVLERQPGLEPLARGDAGLAEGAAGAVEPQATRMRRPPPRSAR